MLLYTDLFASIQGESSLMGFPTIFLRLYGCPIGCSFCDQPQIPNHYRRLNIAHMVERIGKIGLRYVCITGGEPLLQEDTIPLVYELILSGYKVSIETSGCVPIEPDPYSRTYKYVMDIKCPCSGVTEKNIYGNLALLKNNDEVKFVIKDRIDYDFFKETLNKYPTAAKVLLSPMFDSEGRQVIGRKLSEWIIEDKLTDVRIQIQQHKILGVE